MLFSQHVHLFVLSLVCSTRAASSTSGGLFPNTTSLSTSKASTAVTTSTSPGLSLFPSSRNATNTANVTGACCFLVQDTVSENYWAIKSYSTTASIVNLTSVITYVTQLPNLTTTRFENITTTTNASFTFTFEVGRNPLDGLRNSAPGPVEVTQTLEGTATQIGEAVVKSPAAFYVYNTVKIITASPVTDEFGNVMCATPSVGAHGDVFSAINENAEAYYGGLGIESKVYIPTFTRTTTETHEETFTSPALVTSTVTRTYEYTSYSTGYANAEGATLVNTPQAGVTISMDPPFIYQPERGISGQTKPVSPCSQDGNTENYGYVPQKVLDFLVQDPHYSKQYPGLISCLPGGPSIIQTTTCFQEFQSSTVQQVGEDLTSSTVIYVGKPGVKPADPTPTPIDIRPKPTAPGVVIIPPGAQSEPGAPFTVPGPVASPVVQPDPTTSIGAIINSIFGNTNIPATPSPNPVVPGPEVIIPKATTMPIAQAPPGAVGSSTNIGGTPFIVIPGPQTIPAGGAQPHTVPYQPIVIPFATTIPLNAAPAGAAGSTTLIGGTTFLVIPHATTIAAPIPAPAGIFPTTVIAGSSFLAIPGPTNIPLSLAPAGLTGSTTIISGTPFLVVPAPTNLPAPVVPGSKGPFVTTTIDGQPYFIIPPTSIPLSLAPSGLSGSTTIISGTPYLVVPQTTSIVAPITVAGITVISGTTKLIITGPTTIPVNPSFSLDGSTTVIDGTTLVAVSGATTVPLRTTTSSTSRTRTSNTAAQNTATSSSKAGAEPTRQARGVWIGAAAALVGGVVVGVL